MEEQLKKFIDAVNEIDVEKCTDKQLQSFCDICHNLSIDCDVELYKRGDKSLTD